MFLKIMLLFAYFLLVFIGARMVEFYATSLASWQCFSTILAIFENLRMKTQQEQNQEYSSQRQDYYEEENMESEEMDSQQPSSTLDSEDGADLGKLQVVNFSTYDEFQDNIKDTTSIWVVKVSAAKRKDIVNKRQWNWMSQRLKRYGIKMGTYKCSLDPRLCNHRRLHSSTVILATPRGYGTDMKVDFHVYQNDDIVKSDNTKNFIYKWIKRKLYPKVKTVHSFSELTEGPISRYRTIQPKPSMSFVYKSNGRVPPLLFTSLSVKFAGRIRFYMFRTNEVSKSGNVFAMNPNTIYNYGKKQGEQFTYSCIEFFLRTLHPEVNDIFVVSVILLNMACWLELFLQKGGPLKRLFYFVWGFAIANVILVSIWLLLIQLLYMPEVQPIIELCLKNFQQVMFTNIAAIIRQDIIQLSKHLHIVIFGFLGYGILLGYLHYKFQRNTDRISFTSIMDLIRYDIEELSELFCSLIGFITPSLRIYRFEESIERILHRLATPDLWLHSKYPTDYIHNLPTWTYYCNESDCHHHDKGESSSDEDIQSENEISHPVPACDSARKNNMCTSNQILSDDCVICLDIYKCGDMMRGLPCDHCFHKTCIDSWLFTNTETSHHRCPVCRWPADIRKGKAEVVDLT